MDRDLAVQATTVADHELELLPLLVMHAHPVENGRLRQVNNPLNLPNSCIRHPLLEPKNRY
ncbi:hypothetical protein [Polaromonas sp.]|uniref:hypothetical protein n=1 Tax=Polaromonas sp. TaxID=1869339 RepID=UPI003BB62134